MLVLALCLVVVVTVSLAGVGLVLSYVVMFVVPHRCRLVRLFDRCRETVLSTYEPQRRRIAPMAAT